jgi:hypothetical protein
VRKWESAKVRKCGPASTQGGACVEGAPPPAPPRSFLAERGELQALRQVRACAGAPLSRPFPRKPRGGEVTPRRTMARLPEGLPRRGPHRTVLRWPEGPRRRMRQNPGAAARTALRRRTAPERDPPERTRPPGPSPLVPRGKGEVQAQVKPRAVCEAFRSRCGGFSRSVAKLAGARQKFSGCVRDARPQGREPAAEPHGSIVRLCGGGSAHLGTVVSCPGARAARPGAQRRGTPPSALRAV